MKTKKQKLRAVTGKFAVLSLNTLKNLKGGAMPACEPEICSARWHHDEEGCYCPPC